jgi:hypothetical protein
VMPGVADERERNRARHPRAGSSSLCSREEIRDHWEDREGGETGGRHSLLARQHSDLSIDFHDRSRTGGAGGERTNPTNGRGTKGERGTRPPRISAARHEFQTGLRAQFTCRRAVSKKGRERGVGQGCGNVSGSLRSSFPGRPRPSS